MDCVFFVCCKGLFESDVSEARAVEEEFAVLMHEDGSNPNEPSVAGNGTPSFGF